MSDTEYQTNLDDQDRLPWLEAVESDDDQEGMSASKLLGFVLAALLALLVVIGGVWWLRSMHFSACDDKPGFAGWRGRRDQAGVA